MLLYNIIMNIFISKKKLNIYLFGGLLNFWFDFYLSHQIKFFFLYNQVTILDSVDAAGTKKKLFIKKVMIYSRKKLI